MISFGWFKKLFRLKITDNSRLTWFQERKARYQENNTDVQVPAWKAQEHGDLMESWICGTQISQGHCKDFHHPTLQWNAVVEALCVKIRLVSSLCEKIFSSYKQQSSSELLMLAI